MSKDLVVKRYFRGYGLPKKLLLLSLNRLNASSENREDDIVSQARKLTMRRHESTIIRK